MSICHKCGKPVYFAERKTSLGKDWHPNCLCCEECGKILQTGRHAEHKGKPYCHNPCYMALFGPRIMGYGQNVFSPANFIKNGGRNGGRNGERNGHYHTIATTPQRPDNSTKLTKREKELVQKVEQFNSFYEKKRGSLLTAEKTDGTLVITGPLRIYWGVIKPIYLRQYDTSPKARNSKSLRHSFYSATREDIQAELKGEKTIRSTAKNTESLRSPKTPTPQKITRGLDDSFLQSPSDGVVFRRPNIKKFNTVAFRGDRPNKWKRASINDHIYLEETRVFTPVIGSCTSVTVGNHMKTPEVIKTLLEKFKVENQADEYQLYIVTETGGEQLLKEDDLPLIERLALGPEESAAKVFIKDRLPPEPFEAFATIKEGSVLIPEPDELTPVQDITLPEEVEMLVALPEPVLRGVIKKFDNDERTEVKKLKEKYDKIRNLLKKRIEEIKTKL